MPAKPTVFVVDDDAAIRKSLGLLLGSVGLNCETFESADDFLDQYDAGRPGCLVLDIRMPGIGGLELQERLRTQGSALTIIFITAHGDVPMAVRAVKAGGIDFLQKPFRDQELLEKIRLALELNMENRAELADREAIASRLVTLTRREREVMGMVVRGKANKVVAIELGLSQRTVEIHRSRIMKKMDAESVTQLVQMAMRADAELNSGVSGPVAKRGDAAH